MINPEAFAQLKQLKSEIKASKPTFEGEIKATSTKFGFVILDEGREVFLPPDEYMKVLPGDRVEVSLLNAESDKPTAEIERLIKSDVSDVIGRYIIKGKGHFVDAEIGRATRWIFIPPNKRANAKDGDFIECKLTRHPFKSEGKAQAEILSVLGNTETPGIEEQLIIRRYQLSHQWPEKVIEEAKAITEQGIEGFKANRENLTHIPFVTIDSSNTQDMDDALYAEQQDNGDIKLMVAIADPAALIAPGSAIDAEAKKRATSTYLIDNAIPMIPAELSTELSSLVADQERLALVISMDIDSSGKTSNLALQKAVVKSHGKLSYQGVASFLTEDQDNQEEIATYSDAIQTSLKVLEQASAQLNNQRPTSVLPDRPDYRIRLNDNKKVVSIEKQSKTVAHKIVEECMIATNQLVAAFLKAQKINALFINHAGIREDRVEQLVQLVTNHGLNIQGEALRKPGEYQQVLKSADALDLDFPLAVIVNRNMERSEMTLEAKPHVGMAAECYTTCTSPIRKYNDLIIHRILAAHLTDVPQPALSLEQAQSIYSQQLQSRSAANDLEQWMKCQYAETLAGQSFEAVICGVNSAGFHARIDENGVEGFIATKELGTSFNQELMEHAKEGQRFQLQGNVTIKVKGVNWDRKQINFELV